MPDPEKPTPPEAPPATPPTPPAQPQGQYTQAQLDAAAAAARRDAEQKAADALKQVEDLKAKSMSEEEKKLAEARKDERTKAEAEFATKERSLNLRLAMAGKVRAEDFDMVAALVPADTPADQLAAKVDEALKARPYLAAVSASPGVPPGGPPPSGPGAKWGPKRVQAALAEGKLNWADVDAAKASGNWDDSL